MAHLFTYTTHTRPQPSENQLLEILSQPCYTPWIGNFCQYLGHVGSCCTALLCFWGSLQAGLRYEGASATACTGMRNASYWEWCEPPKPSSNKSVPATDDFQTGTQGETNKFLAIFITNKTRENHSRITTSVIWPLLLFQRKQNYFIQIKDHFCWETRNIIPTNAKY